MRKPLYLTTAVTALALLLGLTGCSSPTKAHANTAPEQTTVGVTPVKQQNLERTLTLSSELVPFQDIDVYAKEAGYVQKLLVDYGSRVKAGQVMAILEIPELQMVLEQDQAAIQNTENLVTHSKNELSRVEAQHKVDHLSFQRIHDVSKSKPGLVAQQEVDAAEGKDLASEAQVEAAQSALASARSQLSEAQAKRRRDQVLYDYSRITAPFAGVVTQRFANLGTLLQAGTNSSTQAMPLVRLSQDDKFRLVIPVPESYVSSIRIGDPVEVHVPSLNRTVPGKVARFAAGLKEDTRTMHTEVDVFNSGHALMGGIYAEATLTLDRRPHALAVPLQAVSREGGATNVWLVADNGQLEERKVQLGLQTASAAEVTNGLRAGDMVVVSDRGSLRPGQQVRTRVVDLMQYQEQAQ